MENKRETNEAYKKAISDLSEDNRNLREDNYNLRSKKNTLIGLAIFLGVAISILLTLTFVYGISKNHAIEVLDLEDELSTYQVLKYYPEFENCTIKYSAYDIIPSTFKCDKGVKIYCNLSGELNIRDGLIPIDLVGKSPDEILLFEDIKLKDIYKDWKRENRKCF